MERVCGRFFLNVKPLKSSISISPEIHCEEIAQCLVSLKNVRKNISWIDHVCTSPFVLEIHLYLFRCVCKLFVFLFWCKVTFFTILRGCSNKFWWKNSRSELSYCISETMVFYLKLSTRWITQIEPVLSLRTQKLHFWHFSHQDEDAVSKHAITHFLYGTFDDNFRQPFANWFVEICSSWVSKMGGFTLSFINMQF